MVLASAVPTCDSYDPAYAYEIAVIVQDGIRRMYENNEDHFYYLTVCNENYVQPPMPEGEASTKEFCAACICTSLREEGVAQVTLFGSGPIFNEALKAQQMLAEKYQRRRRCLERHQLHRTAPRGAERRSLESPASD